jgi:hypothetical protein
MRTQAHCIDIGYPVAYYAARKAGRSRGVLLAAFRRHSVDSDTGAGDLPKLRRNDRTCAVAQMRISLNFIIAVGV